MAALLGLTSVLESRVGGVLDRGVSGALSLLSWVFAFAVVGVLVGRSK